QTVSLPLWRKRRRGALEPRVSPIRDRGYNRPMRHAADNVGTTILETRWGYLGLTLSERGIVALELPHPDRALMARRLQAAWPGASPVAPEELAELSETLERYFDGEPVVFRESLDLRPWTPFQ